MLKKTICCSALYCLSLFAQAAADVVSEPPRATLAAGSTTAVIFSKKSPNLTLKKAYNLQKAFVKNSVAKGVDIVGYKAGLTTPESATAMGLQNPISGVLLQAPLAGSEAQVSIGNTSGLMLEMEVAYLISRPVTEKITAEQLPGYIAAVAPAIEIPQVNFPSNDFKGLDVIANNALSYKLMIGEWQAHAGLTELDALPVSLACNGKVRGEGKGSYAMGSQSRALLWLINHILDQGYKIQKGQVLITGTLVKATPAKPCAWVADYGKLGKLRLNVVQ